MNVPLLNLKAQYLSIKEKVDQAISEVVASQQFILGPKVAECERAVAEYCRCAHAVGGFLEQRCFARLPDGGEHRPRR